MAKAKVSDKTKEEALQVARATQRPGQTKEQTKLIAQGIQKGIEQYKKQQKDKARERDRRKKKGVVNKAADVSLAAAEVEIASSDCSKLPWVLLGLSWVGFGAYFALSTLL